MKVGIIGSGISGLYSALLLKKNGIDDVRIFEEHDIIGGRIKNIRFEGMSVVAGAGVGRVESDELLLKLCNDLKVTTRFYDAKSIYSKDIKVDFEVINKIEELKQSMKFFSRKDRSVMTFKEFAIKHMGKREYEKLILYIGETDYEEADVVDVLYDYGFDKSFSSGFKAFTINWDELLASFEKIFRKQLVLGVKVDKIVKKTNGKYSIVVGGHVEEFDKVIIATGISSVKDLLGENELFDNVICQSFARVYVKLNKPLDLEGFRSMITVKPFQKIIEMSREKCVYMISYCDNKMADEWQKKKHSLEVYIEKKLNNLFGDFNNFEVKNVTLVYWKCGTHFFKPMNAKYKSRDDFLKDIQNPGKDDVYIVGEAFSRNQGWCEGALESVHAVMGDVIEKNKNKKKITSKRRSRSRKDGKNNKEDLTTIILTTSTKSEKKLMAIIGNDKVVHFGAKGYSDYTKHRDADRKERYISRHKAHENWEKSGITTAGFWSRWILWNKLTLIDSIKDVENRFGVKISLVKRGY